MLLQTICTNTLTHTGALSLNYSNVLEMIETTSSMLLLISLNVLFGASFFFRLFMYMFRVSHSLKLFFFRSECVCVQHEPSTTRAVDSSWSSSRLIAMAMMFEHTSMCVRRSACSVSVIQCSAGPPNNIII